MQLIVIETAESCAAGKEEACEERVRRAIEEARSTGLPAVLALLPGRQVFVVDVGEDALVAARPAKPRKEPPA